jgi:tellurite methyltransferase
MKRPITGFHQDAESHWVAELSCGHGQHVRHDPPFQERRWVTTQEGRDARIGASLDCVRCDRREMPDGHAAVRRTAEFDAASVPAALLKSHTTKRGVWALIHVLRGRVEYRVEAPFHTLQTLEAGSRGVVLPEVEHCVAPLGEALFFVEFWRAAARDHS